MSSIFGYMIGALFADLNISEELGGIITAWNFGKLGTVIAICLITCFMGMVTPGSFLVVIFGPMFITTLASVGVNVLLVLLSLIVMYLNGEFALTSGTKKNVHHKRRNIIFAPYRNRTLQYCRVRLYIILSGGHSRIDYGLRFRPGTIFPIIFIARFFDFLK